MNVARRKPGGIKHWRILGQLTWVSLGQAFPLGAGYRQSVESARSLVPCLEPGCEQTIAPGQVYVAYWRVHGTAKQGRPETYCLAHAPVAVEVR